MHRLFCFLTLLCCSLICYGQGVVKSVCVERNASGNERYAAAQLREFLHKGGISTDTLAMKKGTIYVGNTHYLRKHFAAYMDSLRDDGYLICGDGKNLCLYGKGNKGTQLFRLESTFNAQLTITVGIALFFRDSDGNLLPY